MINKPYPRSQIDGAQDAYSVGTGIDCSDDEDKTRQEFKDEADVNKLLARHGVNVPLRPPVFGEVDYTLDLQMALGAIASARQAYSHLPANLRDKYPNWQSLLNALEGGELRLDNSEPPPAPPPAPPA